MNLERYESRTSWTRTVGVVAVAVVAVATLGGNTGSVSKASGQAEPGIELKGKKLFERETFGGNGRTCQTCRSKRTGTLTLADVQQIINKAVLDHRFLIHDALDDDGVGTTRVQAHATIRYTIPWASVGDDGGMTRARRTSPSFADSHRPGTRRRWIRFCSTIGTRAHAPQEQALWRESETITRTPSNRRQPSPMPLPNSSEPTLTSSPPDGPPSGSLLVDRRLSCPLESRWSSSEDARSLSTLPSLRLPRTASAPSVIAGRC